jgi:nitrate reductase gamma subunit
VVYGKTREINVLWERSHQNPGNLPLILWAHNRKKEEITSMRSDNVTAIILLLQALVGEAEMAARNQMIHLRITGRHA